MDMDELAAIADEFRHRVREEDPDANGWWLAQVCPEWADRYNLLFVLAAAVPVDRHWLQLTDWAEPAPDPLLIDEIAVERACHGERVPLTRRERDAAIERLNRRGWGAQKIAQTLGISQRLVTRHRRVARGTAPDQSDPRIEVSA